MPRTVLSLKATIDNSNSFVMDRIYYLTPKGTNLKFIIAILNSRLIDFYYKFNFGSTHVGGGYLDLRGTQITKLPIKITEQQDKIVKLVDKMLFMNKRLNEIKDKQTDEKVRLEKEIKKTDEEIDQEVYKIYGITKEEQKVIEESLK